MLLAALALLPVFAAPTNAATPNNSLRLSATYDASATLLWAKAKLKVRSTATVTNDTQDGVNALTFNLVPAKIGQMTLKSVTVGETPVVATKNGQTLTVPLPAPLAPAGKVTVTIVYVALFGSTATDKQWLFTKAGGIATAYRWIPWLSRLTAFKRPNIGDPFTTGVSKRVRVSLTSDRPMVYATSGRQTSVDGLTQTFEAQDVRDFNFTASPSYLTLSGVLNGVEITVYYRLLPGAKLLQWTTEAMQRFSDKVGAYPYPTMSVAEVPFGQGMESPAMTWVSQVTLASSRKQITIHEAAHQWFYSVVGNDQVSQPFVDEAMTEFLTRDMLGHRASRCAVAALDSTIYEYTDACYYEVIYVQGDLYLDAYRLRVGDAAFWTGVQNYYQTYRFSISTIRQLFDTLDAAAPPELAGGHETRFPRTFPPPA